MLLYKHISPTQQLLNKTVSKRDPMTFYWRQNTREQFTNPHLMSGHNEIKA